MTWTEKKIEQLQQELAQLQFSEQLERVESNLRELFVAAGHDLEDAQELAREGRQRVVVDPAGGITVKLMSGGRIVGERGLRMLASEIGAKEAKKRSSQSMSAQMEKKRHDPLYRGIL